MDTAEESVLTGNVAQAPQHFYQLVFCTVKSLALKLFYFNREHVTLFFFFVVSRTSDYVPSRSFTSFLRKKSRYPRKLVGTPDNIGRTLVMSCLCQSTSLAILAGRQYCLKQ